MRGLSCSLQGRQHKASLVSRLLNLLGGGGGKLGEEPLSSAFSDEATWLGSALMKWCIIVMGGRHCWLHPSGQVSAVGLPPPPPA